MVGASHARQLHGVPKTGGPDEAARRLAEFQDAGATHIVMGFADGEWRGQCDLLAEAMGLLRRPANRWGSHSSGRRVPPPVQ